MPLPRSAGGFKRMVEQAIQELLSKGLPADRLINQVPGKALPPASGSARGAVLLSDSTPADVGVAAAGTSAVASRADHVHGGAGGGGAAGTTYILIVDEKTAGTEGGTFTSGAWRTRDLTTEVVDTGGDASVAANQITLAAGTYRYRIAAPAFLTNYHQARLYDITHSALVRSGMNAYAQNDTTCSVITGRVTLAGSTVFEVQHQCNQTRAINGFGIAINGQFTVDAERYTVCEFWKEA